MSIVARETEKLIFELRSLFQLQHTLTQRLRHHNMFFAFSRLEMPLSCLLASMERSGVCVERHDLLSLAEDIENCIAKITKEAHDCAGVVFNLASPDQVANTLYSHLSLPQPSIASTSSRLQLLIFLIFLTHS